MKRFTPHAAMLLSILLLQWSVPASSQSAAPVSSQARLQDLAGKVMTVNGPIDPSALGVTPMHEHIFIDLNDPMIKLSPKRSSNSSRPVMWSASCSRRTSVVRCT
jgi:hypothetical protein